MTHFVTVGADPETWLTKNGIIIPSVGLVPGTKEAPFKVEKSTSGLTLQEDNVSVELGWKPTGAKEFGRNAQAAFLEAQIWVQNNIGKEYGLVGSNPDVLFKPEDLLSKQAMTFGCLPDQDAYLEGDFRTPIDPLDANLDIGNHRFAGGHIHIGYDKENAQIPPWALVRMMDFYYVYWLMDERDKQGKRRALYGQPGIYREKPYGVEYRTPSNFWLYNPGIVGLISKFAQDCLNRPRMTQKFFKLINWDKVQESIKTETAKLSYAEMQDVFEGITYAGEEPTKFKKAA